VTLDWAACALIMAAASLVLGLAGFGIALVAMAFLPYFMPPATAIAVLTIYTIVFAIAIFVPVRHHLTPGGVAFLLVGTVLGTPLGVWTLVTVSASTLNRVIGATLVVVVLLEWAGVYPERLTGRRFSIGAGLLAGMMGGAVGMPGPPVVLYSTTQGWSPRTIKANLQVFFFVNQVVILTGYWWAGLFDPRSVAPERVVCAPRCSGHRARHLALHSRRSRSLQAGGLRRAARLGHHPPRARLRPAPRSTHMSESETTHGKRRHRAPASLNGKEGRPPRALARQRRHP
jgi:hypothetical protein